MLSENFCGCFLVLAIMSSIIVFDTGINIRYNIKSYHIATLFTWRYRLAIKTGQANPRLPSLPFLFSNSCVFRTCLVVIPILYREGQE